MLSNITVLDFETTGLQPESDFVTEIGAVRVRNGKITSRFETLVNFGGVVPQNITEITGLTTEACATGKDPRLAFALLRNFIGDDTIVAHNAPFDISFLARSYVRYGSVKALTNPFLCTALLASRYASGISHGVDAKGQPLGPWSLANLCLEFGVVRDTAHRAMSDVLDTAEVLENLFYNAENCHEGWKYDGAEDFISKFMVNRYFAPRPGRQPLGGRWLPEYAQPFVAPNTIESDEPHLCVLCGTFTVSGPNRMCFQCGGGQERDYPVEEKGGSRG